MKEKIKKIIGEHNIKSAFYMKNILMFNLKKIFLKKCRKNIRIYSNNIDFIKEFKIKNEDVFFGYYDKVPFDTDKKIFLASSTRKTCSNNKGNINIGYFSVEKEDFFKISETRAWCWQQGCRLQWFDEQRKAIIYNDFVNGRYVSLVRDVVKKCIIKKIAFPIYDISIKKDYGISLNFSRLERLRPGYGYKNLKDSTIKDKAPKNDGVYFVDLKTNKQKLLFSLDYLSRYKPQKSMENAEHYVNHISINPSGNRFMFFHLWKDSKNIMRSRVFTCEFNGKNLYLLTNEQFVSHYSWKNDKELLIFSNHKKAGLGYYLYKDETQNKKIISPKYLKEDGHPTFISNNFFLSDTYPDKNNIQHLFAFDFKKNKMAQLLDILMRPTKLIEMRCDLHPRVEDGFVCVDCKPNKKRKMLVLKMKN